MCFSSYFSASMGEMLKSLFIVETIENIAGEALSLFAFNEGVI